MTELKLSGLGVALITPFKEDLNIDFEALDKVINHVINGGCDYIVALGTTAETPTLTEEEKILLTDYIRTKVDGRIPLVIGIGGNNTKAVCEDIIKRDLTGYSAILSVTPYYNKPSQQGLLEHYSAIAEVSPLPVILYNVPGRTGVNLSALTVIKLSSLYPKICGIKEASGNISISEEVIRGVSDSFMVISGDDATTSKLMKTGGVGVISVLANAYPAQVKRLLDLCFEGNYEKAFEIQDVLNKIVGPLFEDGNPSGVKAALYDLGLIKNILRLPLTPVSEHVSYKIKEAAKIISSL